MQVTQDGNTLTITGLTEPEAMECLRAAGQHDGPAKSALRIVRRSKTHRIDIDRYATTPGPVVIYIPASDSFNLVITG